MKRGRVRLTRAGSTLLGGQVGLVGLLGLGLLMLSVGASVHMVATALVFPTIVYEIGLYFAARYLI